MNIHEIYNEAIDGPPEEDVSASVNKLMDKKAHAEWLKLPQTEAFLTQARNAYKSCVDSLENNNLKLTNEQIRVGLGEQLAFKKVIKMIKNGITIEE